MYKPTSWLGRAHLRAETTMTFAVFTLIATLALGAGILSIFAKTSSRLMTLISDTFSKTDNPKSVGGFGSGAMRATPLSQS